MPVSINHSTSSYLPVTSPSKSSYRHHCSPSSYKSSYSTLSDKYSYPSSRYSSYSRTSSLSDDSGLSITGTSCTRDRSSDSQDSTLSRYSKVRSSSSSDSTSSALKSYSSSTLSRKSTPSSRYLTDLNDISVADIRLRFSSLPKTDSIRPTKLSESRSYSRSESLQPLALSSRKSALSTTLEQPAGSCDEVNDENHNSVPSEDDNANLNESVESVVLTDECDQYDQVVPTDEISLSNSPVKPLKGVGKSVESINEDLGVIYDKRKAEEEPSEPAVRSRSKIDDDVPQLPIEEANYSKDLVKSSPLRSATASTAVSSTTGGLNGLRNIGNTCFLNSVVQCLSNTPQLKEFLISGAYISEINSGSRGALIKSFAELIKEIWQGENKSLNTTAFKGHIQRFAPRFMGYSQQDAQEFLRYLLDGLHEDLNRVKVKPKDHVQIDDNLSEPQKAIESWKQYLRYDNSKIVDLFGGQLKSTLQCTQCGHCSTTYEVFWDLSLPFPARTGNATLNQCLELFTRKEELDGNEMPTCSRCEQRRKCTKALTIQKLPTILVLHLKRFSPERLLRKLTTNVEFPLTDLDMSPYLDPSTAKAGTPLYNLYAVSNHIGSAHSGHYTAYCHPPHSDTWYHFNDARVSQLPVRQIVSNEAYILFYHQNGRTAKT